MTNGEGNVVRAIDTRFSLDNGASVELLLVQWDTKAPHLRPSNSWVPPLAEEIQQKRAILDALRVPLSERSARPLFVLIPELSLPLQLLEDIERLVSSATKPVVVIAGLEHLSNEQFTELLRSGLYESTSLANPEPRRRVNAAMIWISSTAGSLQRYLQVKRELSDDEAPDFSRGSEAFLFTSPDQNLNHRLNFAVGICSDFTSADHVLRLRQEMGRGSHPPALDLMFVLQMNPDQKAAQFLIATGAFFQSASGLAPEATLIETAKSALVFVNKASPSLEVTDYGKSAVHFQYNELSAKRSVGEATFELIDYRGYGFFSAVFRERRPSAYLIEYIPLRLRDAVPGRNEPYVFHRARHADLRQLAIPLVFQELAPVIHWVVCAWELCAGRIAATAAADFRIADADGKEKAVATWVLAWQAAIDWWKTRIGPDDSRARHYIRLLMDDLPGSEPNKWGAEKEVCVMLCAFILLVLDESQRPELSKVTCAHIELAEGLVTFATGHYNWTWKTVADRYYQRHKTQLDTLERPPLLAIQEVSGGLPGKEEHAFPGDIVGSETFSPDDITAPPLLRAIRCVGIIKLYDRLCAGPTYSAATAAVVASVQKILA